MNLTSYPDVFKDNDLTHLLPEKPTELYSFRLLAKCNDTVAKTTVLYKSHNGPKCLKAMETAIKYQLATVAPLGKCESQLS